MQSWIVCIQLGIIFLLCTGRIVAQFLHLVSGCRPDTQQLDCILAVKFFSIVRDIEHAAFVQTGHFMYIFQPGKTASLQHIFHILDTHLQHRTQLFVEQGAD